MALDVDKLLTGRQNKAKIRSRGRAGGSGKAKRTHSALSLLNDLPWARTFLAKRYAAKQSPGPIQCKVPRLQLLAASSEQKRTVGTVT